MSLRLRYAAIAFAPLVFFFGGSPDNGGGEPEAAARSGAASGIAVAATRQDTVGFRAAPAIDADELARVGRLDPDDAIERYRQECNAGDTSQYCRALRRRVEYLFLDTLVSLRKAGEKLDPQLYRVAARAENPRLAILGLRGLLLGSQPVSAEDEQLVVADLDSPYAGVRRTVLQLGARLPSLSGIGSRIAADADPGSSIAFLDESRSPDPDPALAGSYPGARYRYFASDATRHWFTTPDPPEKVIAFLARNGRQALTADEFKAKREADAQQGYMQAMMSGDESRMMAAMQQMTAKLSVDWTSMLGNISDTGEIRYIELAPDQVVAVFDDEILHATSIVAPVPPPAAEAIDYLNTDFEKALEAMQERVELEERIRQVLGH